MPSYINRATRLSPPPQIPNPPPISMPLIVTSHFFSLPNMLPKVLRSPKKIPAMAFPVTQVASSPGHLRFRGRAASPVVAAGGEQAPPPQGWSLAAVPASLRLIQVKKKLLAPARPRSAAGSAVEALAAAVEAVQGAAAGGAAAAGAARDARDAVAWVFGKVHFESPELAVGLLGLVASCLGAAVEREMARTRAEAAAAAESPADGDAELWAEIGILHGEGDRAVAEGDAGSGWRERREAAYKSLIDGGEASSLILSNYAQLLYQYDNDLDRAEKYFRQAVAAQPEDGEAMRRYAMFLWNGRGDLAAAEDMFTGAIEAEPESTLHRGSYASFLWTTGGVDTCILDDHSRGGDID